MPIEHLCTKLEQTVQIESQHGELPDFLHEPLLEIARHPERFFDQEELIALLIQQVRMYDSYAECGCFKDGYSASDIKTTLGKLGIET